MGRKSWLVTIIPLIAYLIGFVYQLVSDTQLTEQEVTLLTNLLYAFIGSGAIGGAKVAVESFAPKIQTS